ncbi:MAG TPA: P-loop NTPase [Methylomirabilota bacterium]|nr:P-loop NTPase [Methylomirabilota bacterium]
MSNIAQLPTPVSEPNPAALAFVRDRDSEAVLRACFAAAGFERAAFVSGSIETAIAQLPKRGSPRLLVVDIGGVDDPLHRLGDLAAVSDPSTEVIVIGDHNDVVLYRNLKAAGVAEYFFKPLVSTVVSRELLAIAKGDADPRHLPTGRLVIVLGVRGGVGATTVAANAAWHLAVDLDRKVMLLDLDLHGGDAALQLDATPGNALVEALQHPDRVDGLFLDRGVVSIEKRLGLLSTVEPLSENAPFEEAAVAQLLSNLLPRYRYVFVDMPAEVAVQLPGILRMPSTVMLVSDGSLIGTREVTRWWKQIGADSPEHIVLHVLNKNGGDAVLPEEALLKALPKAPDVVIPYDRHIGSAAQLGVRAVQKRAAMHRAMADLSRHLTGEPTARPQRLWQRMFG